MWDDWKLSTRKLAVLISQPRGAKYLNKEYLAQAILTQALYRIPEFRLDYYLDPSGNSAKSWHLGTSSSATLCPQVQATQQKICRISLDGECGPGKIARGIPACLGGSQSYANYVCGERYPDTSQGSLY